MSKKETSRRSSKRRSKKKPYRIRNWPEYNASLARRGSLTIWLDEETADGWYNTQPSGKRGASNVYSDSTIVAVLTLQVVYRLPLRQTQALLQSLLELMGLDLWVPDYTTLCRRRRTLRVELGSSVGSSGPGHNPEAIHLVVDSTGFKVYGEGEWKVRQHGWSQRRTWRKLHVGINEATAEIVTAVGSTPGRADKQVLEELLEQVEVPIDQVSGDGGYDYAECYEAIDKRDARAIIPPRRNARLHEKDSRWQQRNEHLKRIRELQGKRRKDLEHGRNQWKEETGYHRRSLVETGMMRLKTIFGPKLGARNTASQDNELLLRCRALNRMTRLGMPQSIPA